MTIDLDALRLAIAIALLVLTFALIAVAFVAILVHERRRHIGPKRGANP